MALLVSEELESKEALLSHLVDGLIWKRAAAPPTTALPVSGLLEVLNDLVETCKREEAEVVEVENVKVALRLHEKDAVLHLRDILNGLEEVVELLKLMQDHEVGTAELQCAEAEVLVDTVALDKGEADAVRKDVDRIADRVDAVDVRICEEEVEVVEREVVERTLGDHHLLVEQQVAAAQTVLALQVLRVGLLELFVVMVLVHRIGHCARLLIRLHVHEVEDVRVVVVFVRGVLVLKVVDQQHLRRLTTQAEELCVVKVLLEELLENMYLCADFRHARLDLLL